MRKSPTNLLKLFVDWIRVLKKDKTSYKTKAEINKNKIIRREADNFKKLCIKEFKNNIKRGIATTIVDFPFHITYDFENEISEIVLEELKKENKTIEFSFSFRHYLNSYKGIKMVAK